MGAEMEQYRCSQTIDLEEAIMKCDISRAVHEGAYLVSTLAKKHNIPDSTLRGWVNGVSEPSKKHQKKVEEIMKDLSKNKKIEKHPSYGYATKKEIELLKTAQGAERDIILKAIKRRAKNHGKL